MSRGWQWQRSRLARSLAIGAALAVLGAASAHAADPIKIGHVAALSGASAQSGEAITRGLSLAIDEINEKAGLMLINNPWGQSNEKGLVAARKADPSIEIAGIEKFENNDVDMVPQLARLKDAGADAIILVVNAPPGAQVMKSRERMGWTAPVVSH